MCVQIAAVSRKANDSAEGGNSPNLCLCTTNECHVPFEEAQRLQYAHKSFNSPRFPQAERTVIRINMNEMLEWSSMSRIYFWEKVVDCHLTCVRLSQPWKLIKRVDSSFRHSVLLPLPRNAELCSSRLSLIPFKLYSKVATLKTVTTPAVFSAVEWFCVPRKYDLSKRQSRGFISE